MQYTYSPFDNDENGNQCNDQNDRYDQHRNIEPDTNEKYDAYYCTHI